MRIALYQPDIAPNTGTILRMAACFGLAVDVIGPTGFNMTDRALRRGGMDYLDAVAIERHLSFEDFLATLGQRRLVLATTRGDVSYTSFAFALTDIVLLGRESAGVPESVHKLAHARLVIPMRSGMRSLNIAVAGSIVISEALRQTDGFPS